MISTAIDNIKKLLQTGFFHIFGSTIINRIIVFFSSFVLIRILTKTEYGAFTYAWNIYCIVLLFSGLGIESGLMQLASEHSGDKQYAGDLMSFSTRFGVAFNIILSLVLLGIGLWAPLKIESGRILLCLLCALPIFQLLYALILVYLRSQKQNQNYSWLSVINSASILVMSVIFAFQFREKGMIAGQYLAILISIFIGVFFYQVPVLTRGGAIGQDDKKNLLQISFISMCNNALSELLYLLDIFVLGIVDPHEEILASYKIATTIPTALTFIPLALMTYVYPFFAEHKDDKKWCLKKYEQILLFIGIVNMVISALLFFLAHFIIQLVFGEQYLDAVPVFRILAINYFISGTFRIISGNLLVTQRKLVVNLITAIISSSVNIIADFFFIQRWSSKGAALATILVTLISSIISTTYLLHTLKNESGITDEKKCDPV